MECTTDIHVFNPQAKVDVLCKCGQKNLSDVRVRQDCCGDANGYDTIKFPALNEALQWEKH